jgi:hypothetical protein
MYSRKTRPNGGRRTALRVSLVVAGACAPVLVVGYAVAATHSGHAANTADVSTSGTGNGAGGWGRGGYTMMPGPAAPASPSQGQGNTVTGGPATNAAAQTSMNWAGYASAGNQGQFTNVSASWTQPAVTCGATDTFASFWVGLDGDGTPTVEQTGTEADCTGGAAVYQGWFEMFPNAPVFYNNPVAPGDAMSASVAANGGGAFTLTLTDATQNWTQTTNQTSNTAELGSAEVIAEAPSNGNVLPLSNFGTASFTNATADDQPIGNENASALTMVSANGVTEATPSALTNGNAFTVTWDSSGANAAAPAPAVSSASPGATAAATGAPTPPATAATPTPAATAGTPTPTSSAASAVAPATG